MKIGIFGENVARPSGFGLQTKLLAEGFAAHNFDVSVYSAQGISNKEQPFKEFSVQYTDYGLLNKIVAEDKPDIFIMFGPLGAHEGFYFTEMNKTVRPYIWLAWESAVAQPDYGTRLKTLGDNRVVHLSEYGKSIWEKYCGTNQPVIPHGIDTKIFHPLNLSKADLRKKYSEKFRQHIDKDAFVLLSVDRNDPRKRHDLTMDAVRRLVKLGHNVQVIFHCQQKNEQGFNLLRLMELYGLTQKEVILTDFNWIAGLDVTEINELYNLADARVCSSGGEGFGVPTVEAIAAGCLNIVPNNTTYPELIDSCGLLVDTGNSSSLIFPDAIFSDIDVESLVQKVEWAMLNENLIREMTDRGVQSIAPKYQKEAIIDRWLALFAKNELKGQRSENERLSIYQFGIGQAEAAIKDQIAIAKLVKDTHENKNILDINCMSGRIVSILMGTTNHVKGISNNKVGESLASENAKLYCKYGVDIYEYLDARQEDTDLLIALDFFDQYKDYEIETLLNVCQPENILARFRTNPSSPARDVVNLKSMRYWLKYFKSLGYIPDVSKTDLINFKYSSLGIIYLQKCPA